MLRLVRGRNRGTNDEEAANMPTHLDISGFEAGCSCYRKEALQDLVFERSDHAAM